MFKFFKRHRVASFVSGVTLAFATGIAFAFWLVDFSGEAYVKVPTLTAPTTVDISGTVTADPGCLPGSDCTLSMRVNNPNGQSLYLFGIQGTLTISEASGGPCDGADFDVNANTPLPNIELVPGLSTVQLPGVLHMKPTARTTCQGAVIRFNATLFHTSTDPTLH